MADGNFDALFLSIAGFKRGYQELYNHQRLVFHLTHPGIGHKPADAIEQ